MSVTVLVAYATADGSTAEIAQRIGHELTRRGTLVEVQSVADLPDPAPSDAVVPGSAIRGPTGRRIGGATPSRFRNSSDRCARGTTGMSQAREPDDRQR